MLTNGATRFFTRSIFLNIDFGGYLSNQRARVTRNYVKILNSQQPKLD